MGIRSSMASLPDGEYERIFGHSCARNTADVASSRTSCRFGRPVKRVHRSMAIHPSQVAEHVKMYPSIKLEQTDGGFYAPVTSSIQEAHKYARARGFEDVN